MRAQKRNISFEQSLLNKTAWRERGTKRFQFYCPQCRHQRVIPFIPKPAQLEHIFRIFVTACFVTLLTWKWFEWKGILVIFPLWAAFEFFYRLRARTVASCPYCGFDPYLFLADVQRARAHMEAFWKDKVAEVEKKRRPEPSAPPVPVGEQVSQK